MLFQPLFHSGCRSNGMTGRSFIAYFLNDCLIDSMIM
jgi:hypothetical protein